MRNLIFLFALMISLTGMRMHYPVLPSFKAKIVKKGDAVFIKATITNNTGDTVKYLTWDCSWRHIYKLEANKKIYVGNLSCEHQGPEMGIVLPFKSDTRLMELKGWQGTNLHDLHFKIGFNYVPLKNKDELFDKANALSKNKNIIWNDEELYVK